MLPMSLRAKYELKKKREAARQRKSSAAGRDIGELPPVTAPKRRDAAVRSLRKFCETYFPKLFRLKWSKSHLRAIAILEQCIREGGLFAFAMPRGNGKTTLARAAATWAIFTGLKKYVVIVAATDRGARKLLRNLKRQIEVNELLLADFPEIVYPIKALGNVKQRAPGQLYEGQPTGLAWKDGELQFASLAGFPNTSGIIETVGITGEIRGKQHDRADGSCARPDLVLIDDPQTKRSAKSAEMTNDREEIINADILGLAGSDGVIAAVMTCTIIRENDLAARFLNVDSKPEWNGETTALLEKMPTRMELWHEYAAIPSAKRNAFYRKRRKEMDAGAVATWPERYTRNDVSAIQFAMNLLFRDEVAFWSEYQNKPLVRDNGASYATPAVVASRVAERERGVVPESATTLTAFIDCHSAALYYAVLAWEPNFTGHVLDYGTWPDQPSRYFSLASAGRTIQNEFAGKGESEQLYLALQATAERIVGRVWRSDAGLEHAVKLCLIDSGDGDHTRTVFDFCRRSNFRAQLKPSKGWGITAASWPMNEWKIKPGERQGDSWVVRMPPKFPFAKLVEFDANVWKSKIHRAFMLPSIQPGSMSLFGTNPKEHELFADHVGNSERPIETSGRGRKVNCWKILPGRPDNHWFDCVVGSAVAASVEGISSQYCAPQPADTSTQAKPRRSAQRLMGR